MRASEDAANSCTYSTRIEPEGGTRAQFPNSLHFAASDQLCWHFDDRKSRNGQSEQRAQARASIFPDETAISGAAAFHEIGLSIASPAQERSQDALLRAFVDFFNSYPCCH